MPAPQRATATWLALLGLFGGCSSASGPASTAPDPTYQTLVGFDAWTSVSRADDPFVEDVDVTPACVGSGFSIEDEYHWLEIDTGACNWVTLSASTRATVAEGQMLQLSVSHYDLEAAAPAEANLLLELGGCNAWSKTIPIPSEAAVYKELFASPCALPEHGNVLFHLNNHGQNTYQLQDLSSLR
jgi:hypothetical protein